MLTGISPYEIFLQVAELKNITRAAQSLNYTQSGVSHAIAALEREMGFSLFLRGQRGVELTRNGEAVLEAVRSLVNQQRNLLQTVASVKNEVTGTIRISSYISISVAWLPHIIKAFQSKYPQVEFELFHGNNESITESILKGKTDCAFMAGVTEAFMIFRPLLEDPMIVALPCGHPLCEKGTLTLDDIMDEPFILPCKGSDTDTMGVLLPTGRPYRVKYVLDDDISVLAMVSNGFGIGVVPALLTRMCAFRIETKPLNPPQSRLLGMATLSESVISTTTRTFLEFVCHSGEIDCSVL